MMLCCLMYLLVIIWCTYCCGIYLFIEMWKSTKWFRNLKSYVYKSKNAPLKCVLRKMFIYLINEKNKNKFILYLFYVIWFFLFGWWNIKKNVPYLKITECRNKHACIHHSIIVYFQGNHKEKEAVGSFLVKWNNMKIKSNPKIF